VPTVATLSQRFDDVLKALTAPAATEQAPAESGTWEALKNRLKGVVEVRPAGEVDWTEVAGRMAGPAKAGDLSGAIRIAEATNGTPPQQLAAWIDAARARNDVDQALGTLTSQALERLRSTQSSGGN